MRDLQWWGELPLRPGAMLQVGPSKLWFHRNDAELRVAIQTDADPISDVLTRQPGPVHSAPPSGFTLHRLAVGNRGALTLMPVLADRAVIARPSHPFALPAGESVTVFISTVLWVDLRMPDSLITLPLFRMSDTWFGRSTIEGELCYATRTALRMALRDMPRRPHRAITAVHVINNGPDALRLHRVRLPVHRLTLFSDAEGGLWTQALQMHRQGAGEATITLRDAPPAAAGDTAQIGAPRQQEEGSQLLQAITSFLP